MSKKGFTLVELSIVLVIIGLLIGGILAAQSMINTAKIQGLVRQVGQFDAAVENFQTKFQQLPGDTNLMGTQIGNNDGMITGYISGTQGNWGFEVAKFWADLSNSGFTNPSGSSYIDQSDSLSTGTTLLPNISAKVPASAAGTNGYVFAYGKVTGTNYYVIGNPTGGSGTSPIGLNPSFKPIDALAIDQKIDDGIANSGNVISSDNNQLQYTMDASYSNILCTSAGGANYITSNSNLTCLISIRLGTSTGDLK